MPNDDWKNLVVKNDVDTFTPHHQNYVINIDGIYDVYNPVLHPKAADYTIANLKKTVEALQHIIGDAVTDGKRLRAFGGTWSLSQAAATNGRLINSGFLSWMFQLHDDQISFGYQGDKKYLWFVQCGKSILRINQQLGDPTKPIADRQTLRTTGASNGQTIVGATATGTHGSRIDGPGSMQDYIVAMHIVVGPNRHVWLERASYPVVRDTFTTEFGAMHVLDDEMFNAALVSFGSFGIIHAVMIETEPLFLLEESRYKMKLTPALFNAMTTHQFVDINAPKPFPANVPYHFEVEINPYDIDNGERNAYVTMMYRLDYKEPYNKPADMNSLNPGTELLALIGNITSLLPGLASTAVNQAAAGNLPLLDKIQGTPSEIFSINTLYGKGMSCEIGVAQEDVERTVKTILAAQQVDNNYAGLMGIRFVKGSKALLAFTKFDMTCTLEFIAVYDEAHTLAFYKRFWDALDAAQIPYTFHWGQMNNFTPERVRKMYGSDNVDKWIAARRKLLSDKVRPVFDSPFLVECGLDDASNPAPGSGIPV